MNTLLLVDDEVSILKSIQRLFLDDDNLEILTASSAKEAIDLLAHQSVDIIISDERMPQISGTQFLHFAREKYPSIQRIILTGYANQEATINAINKAEVFRFLTKPWDAAELVTTVKHALVIKNLRDNNERLNLEIASKNDALEKVNASLERTVAERTLQLRKTLDQLNKQNLSLKSQRTGIVELLLSLLGQYDRFKARTARQVWESIRTYAENNQLELSEMLPYSAMLKVFVDPTLMHGDATFLKLLSSVEGFGPIADLIDQSTENFDGSGPKQAAAAEIPLEARLLRIASDFHTLNPDNLTLSRNYILSQQRRLYDPELSNSFLLNARDSFSTASSFKVDVENLLVGMIACKDIQLVNGSILLAAGTTLNATMIAQLQKVRKLIKDQIEILTELKTDPDGQ